MRLYPDPKPVDEMSRSEKIEFYTRAQMDYHYFCEVILGYYDMNKHHKTLCTFLQEKEFKFNLILMPRYSFKSCIVTIGGSLWDLIRDVNYRILIYSDSVTKAQGFLRGVKTHVEGKAPNSRFREFYPNWETEMREGKWTENQILISKRELGHVEPSIDTSGIESSKVGMHFDKIYFDDIVSDLNVTTKGWMDKVHELYKKSLSLLKPGGQVVMTGTRWHFSDTYGRIIKENRDRKNYGIFIRQALVDGYTQFADIGEHSLTLDFLNHQRNEQGSYNFSCLYQNSPVDDEMAMFKQDDFNFYGSLKVSENVYREGVYGNLYITGSLDPAGGGGGGDAAAGVICGTDSKLRIYILDTLQKRNASPSEQIDWVIRMNNKYKLSIFGIETIFFRGMLMKELEMRVANEKERNFNFNSFGIKEFKTRWFKGEGKRIRIQNLIPFHERGDILFPGDCIEKLFLYSILFLPLKETLFSPL